jgi:chaperonin GroEL
MAKQVKNIDGVIRGIKLTSEVVGVTMGWGGKNVVFGLGNGVVSTKDGATVVGNISFEDAFEECGRQMVRDACWRVANTAGDGTTLTAVLSGAFVEMGRGCSRMDIERWDRDIRSLVADLRYRSISVGSKLWNVCNVSSNYDKGITDMSYEILTQVGVDSRVVVERVMGNHMSYEVKRGYGWSRGLVRGEFLGGKRSMTLDNPLIVCVNGVIKDVKEMQRMMEAYDKHVGRDLLLIVDDMQGGAISTMIATNGNGFKIAVVHAPEYGRERMEMLSDLSLLCDMSVYDVMSGKPLSKFDGKFGVALRAEVSMDGVFIVTDKKLDDVVEEIKKELETCDDARRVFLERRLSSLVSSLAIIKVGSNIGAELSRLTDVIDDCIKAGKSAIRGGILPGGGVALAEAAARFEGKLSKALTVPIMTIYGNAETKWYAKDGKGIDLRYGVKADMIDVGVIDCTDVVVAAVENAWQVAKVVLTAKYAVC